MKIRDLKDTTNLMTSNDYKDRLLAEYWQLKIRHQKLQVAIARKSQRLDRDTKTPIDTLQAQAHVMERVFKSAKTKSQRRRYITGGLIMNYEAVTAAGGIFLLISVFVTFGLVGALAFEMIKMRRLNRVLKARITAASRKTIVVIIKEVLR